MIYSDMMSFLQLRGTYTYLLNAIYTTGIISHIDMYWVINFLTYKYITQLSEIICMQFLIPPRVTQLTIVIQFKYS